MKLVASSAARGVPFAADREYKPLTVGLPNHPTSSMVCYVAPWRLLAGTPDECICCSHKQPPLYLTSPYLQASVLCKASHLWLI